MLLMTTRRRIGASGWLALGLIVGIPALAEAQLFPNQNVKRKREACVNEPPFNAHVRRDFYGYYPTCWSKFPDGWACPCPNPELPNAAESYAKRPVELQERRLDDEDPGDAANPADPSMPGAGPDPGLPAIPPNRSPFDLDSRPETPAPGDPAPRPSIPGTGRPTTRPGASPSGPPSTSLLEMPSLPAPTQVAESRLEPGAMTLAPEATFASNAGTDRPDLGPLPSAPMPDPSTPVYMGTDQPTTGAPAPASTAQAPRRRSLLGGLFGNKLRR